jgi:hypothetical protein
MPHAKKRASSTVRARTDGLTRKPTSGPPRFRRRPSTRPRVDAGRQQRALQVVVGDERDPAGDSTAA